MSSIIRLRNLGWPAASNFEDEMNRVMERFLAREPDARATFFPAANVSETDANIAVTLEIPGMDGKDIDISVVGTTLTVKGEKKNETEEKGEYFHRVERGFGAFTRTFELPASVVLDKVSADYKNGILRITLPKTDEARRREVKVKVS